MKHFPIRTETTGSVTTYFALCGTHQSTDKKDFANPARPEQVTCEKCVNYDRIRSADEWTLAIRVEE